MCVHTESSEAWALEKVQYEVGKVDHISVLLMQARVVASRSALVGIRNDQLINRVNLHLALAGSFEESEGKRVVEGAVKE